MSKHAAQVRFRFTYEGMLAGDPYEISPSLLWWTSTLRSAKRGRVRVDIDWDDEERQRSKSTVITVPIAAHRRFRPDDNIWVEAIVQSPTGDGMYVGARAGAASMRMQDVYEAARKEGSYRRTFDLRMAQLIIDGEAYRKGQIHVELLDADRIVREWKFDDAGPYDLSVHSDRVQKLFAYAVSSAMYPYSRHARRAGVGYRSSVKRIESIHAPVWRANVSVPGWAYWVNYSDYEPDESFAENISRVALGRHGVTRDWFVSVVDDQFARNDDTYDENFTTAVAIAADTCAILSVSLFYKSDESYVLQESDGGGWFGGSGDDEMDVVKRAMESFNDALTMNGDDCEGLGALVHRVARIIKIGMPDRRGNHPWNERGGWSDPVLQRMQRVLYWYVSGGGLGSVTAARVGGAKSRDLPMIIGSDGDRRAKIGGHMWQEFLPVSHVEELCRRTNATGKPVRIRKATYPAWLRHLPYTVGEGTGAVYPLLRPIGEYYSGALGREKTQEFSVRLNLMHTISKRARYLRMGQMQRLQKMMQDVPDARPSTFYRHTTTFYTDECFREGIPIADFMWTQTSARRSEANGGGAGGDSEGEEWTYGANMRDKIRTETPNGRRLGLVVVPPCTDSEMEAVRSIMRQLPPLEVPTLSHARKAELENYAQPFVREFQRLADGITAGRQEEREHGRLNVIFRREEFFSGMVDRKQKVSLRDGLLDDIERIESIYRVETVFEAITDRVYNVRIELYMNISPESESDAATNGIERRMKRLFGVSVRHWEEPDDCGPSLVGREEVYHFSWLGASTAFAEGVTGCEKPRYGRPPDVLRAYARGHTVRMEARERGELVSALVREDDGERVDDGDVPSKRYMCAGNGCNPDSDTDDEQTQEMTPWELSVQIDDYGLSYVRLAETGSEEEIEDVRIYFLPDVISQAKAAGYEGHAWVMWQGANQLNGWHALYLFRTAGESEAFKVGMEFDGKLPPGASDAEERAFNRGKRIRSEGSEDFKGMFSVVR